MGKKEGERKWVKKKVNFIFVVWMDKEFIFLPLFFSPLLFSSPLLSWYFFKPNMPLRVQAEGERSGDRDRKKFQNWQWLWSISRSRQRERLYQQFDKSKIVCYNCYKFGHYCSECYTKLPQDKENQENLNFAKEK